MKELIIKDTIEEYLSVSKYINWNAWDIPETGFGIHALNAVYIKSLSRWIRLDARGGDVKVWLMKNS